MHVDRARTAGVSIAPHVREQEVARQHAPAVFQEVAQQQELFRGEPDLAPAGRHDVPFEIDLDVAERERGVLGLQRRRAAEHGAHARDDLARAERLGDVVVGPELEPRDALLLFGARGDHDDRHGAGLRVGPQGAADVAPVEPWEHDVQEKQIRRVFADSGHDSRPRQHDADLEPGLPQSVAEQVRDVLVVFDDEQARRARVAWSGGSHRQLSI